MRRINTFLVALTSVIFLSGTAWAFDSSIPVTTEDPESFQAEQALKCGDGQTGWWAKLETQPHFQSLDGGLNINTGTYTGCGTCGECRIKLNNSIDAHFATQRQNCAARGGIAKSEFRGQWREAISTYQWNIRVDWAQINCEKWVSCQTN